MKTSKLVVAIVLAFIAGPIFAQPSGRSFSAEDQEERINKQVERYAEELQLDDLQKALLKTNFTEYGNKQRDIFQGEGSREDKMASLKDLRMQQNEELAKFLSEEQMETLKELQQKERKKRRGRRPNRRGPQ